MKLKRSAVALAVVGALAVTLPHAASAETVVVSMKFNEDTGDFVFEPARIVIAPGDTVVWRQDDSDNEHNVVAYPDRIPEGTEPFEGTMLTALGETWRMRFEKPGSYFYHCHPHEEAGMRGLVVVGRESLPEEFREPRAGEATHAHHGQDRDDEVDEHGDGGEMHGHGQDKHHDDDDNDEHHG
jgi:plastocyanin